jgi:Tol biopolymer transport system component
VAGVATFADLTVDLVGSGYVLTASSGSLARATGDTFSVSAGLVSADRSTVEALPVTVRTCCDTATVTVTVRDAAGNAIPGATVSLVVNGDRAGADQPGPTDDTGRTTGRVWAGAIGPLTVSATANGTGLVQQAALQAVAGIAFESAGTSQSQILVAIAADSRKPGPVNVPQGAADPAWSPDGSKLALTLFGCANDVCGNDIVVVDANGSNVTNVTRGRGWDGFNKSHPSWSADGTHLAFAIDTCHDLCNNVGSVALAGGDISVLTNGGDIKDPAWGPDTRIAFVAFQCPDEGCGDGVFTVDAGGSGAVTQLSPVFPGGTIGGVAWSPRGGRIAFSMYFCDSEGGGCTETDLFLFQTNGGSDPFNVTQNVAGDATDPAWAPDGSAIAFTSGDCSEGCAPTIALVSPDGTNASRLARGRNPTWR